MMINTEEKTHPAVKDLEQKKAKGTVKWRDR